LRRSATIRSLLLRGCPTAVALGVAFRVIDPVQTATTRASTHIGEKVLEDFPTLADLDSTTSVSKEIGAASILAALEHIDPRNIGRGTSLPGLMPMLGFCGSYHFGPQASTTSGIAFSEIRGKNYGGFSASARTLPAGKLKVIASATQDAEPSEFLPNQVVQEHKCLGTL
jgi:hypothetical protein